MKLDDQRQLPFAVEKLGALIRQFDQLISQMTRLLPTSPGGTKPQIDASDYPVDPIRLKDAAAVLGVHVSMVHRLLKSGQLRAWRLPGGQKRVSRQEVLSLTQPVEAVGKSRPRERSRPAARRRLRRDTTATLERFGISVGEDTADGA